MSLNYDKTTFGLAPAALYLVLLLNERGDPILARKVGKVLRSTRELVNDVVASHLLTDKMKTSSFGKLIAMIKDQARASAMNLPDPFIGHLVSNILIGEIRTFERRAANAAKSQTVAARNTKSGNSVPMIKALRTDDELYPEDRIMKLHEKSRKYLLRKGKINTLY